MEEPRNYKEVMVRTDKEMWIKTIDEEIQSLKTNNKWSLYFPHESVAWVNGKTDQDGEIRRYNARIFSSSGTSYPFLFFLHPFKYLFGCNFDILEK